MGTADDTTGPGPSGSSAPPPGSDLRRSLTHRQTTMIGLGSALGTGLFLGSGTAIGIAGPAVILSYVLGAALIGIIATALGEMTVAHPVRGSFGAIAHRYLGPWAGFLARWLYWMAGVVAVGSEVVAAALYLRWWWPQLPMPVAIAAVAVLVVGINLYSVGSFGTLEFWLSALKVTALSVFLLCGALLVFVGLPHNPASGLHHLTAHGGFFPKGGGAVWVALSVVMFAFIGFETLAIAAAETADPARSIRTSMRQLVWRLALFYVASVALVVTLSPWQQAAGAGGSVESSPFVRLFADIGVPAAATLTNAVVLIAAVSAANANLYGASRLLHSLGHDGLAPRVVTRLNGRGVPAVALLASAAGIVVAAVLAATQVGGVFTVLLSIATFGVLLVWLLILASYVAFRRSRAAEQHTHAGFRLWGGAVTACVGVAGVLAVAATAAVVPDMRKAALVGGVFTLALAAGYAVLRARRRSAASAG